MLTCDVSPVVFVVEMNLKCHLVVHLFLHRGGSDVTLMMGSGRSKSRITWMRGRVGGWGGTRLQQNDIFSCAGNTTRRYNFFLKENILLA